MFKDNGHKGECSTYNNNIIQDSDKKKIVLLLKFDLLKFHSKRYYDKRLQNDKSLEKNPN